MQKVDYRYSDSDFVAYLMSLGYKHTNIEIVKDRFGKIKAFVHFYEVKDELLKHFSDFRNNSVKVDILKFSTNRKIINKLIKSEILKYQANEIQKKA